jgi:hypothetical protein
MSSELSHNDHVKLRVKLGATEIDYEGNSEFLSQEIMPTLGKMLELVEARADLNRPTETLQLESDPGPSAELDAIDRAPNEEFSSVTTAANVALASYLRKTGGDTTQVLRFLATAAWLFRRGSNELSTTLVAKALQENHQKKLGNPSDCLNQNVAKGFCEKTKTGFFITPDGWSELEGKGVRL